MDQVVRLRSVFHHGWTNDVAMGQILQYAKFPAALYERFYKLESLLTFELLNRCLEEKDTPVLIRTRVREFQQEIYAVLSDMYSPFDNEPLRACVDENLKKYPQLVRYVDEYHDLYTERIYNSAVSVQFGDQVIHPMMLITNSINGTKSFKIQFGALFIGNGNYDLLGRKFFEYIHRGKRLKPGIQNWENSFEEWLLKEVDLKFKAFVKESPAEWVGKMKKLYDRPVEFKPQLSKQFKFDDKLSLYEAVEYIAREFYQKADHLEGSERLFKITSYYW